MNFSMCSGSVGTRSAEMRSVQVWMSSGSFATVTPTPCSRASETHALHVVHRGDGVLERHVDEEERAVGGSSVRERFIDALHGDGGHWLDLQGDDVEVSARCIIKTSQLDNCDVGP